MAHNPAFLSPSYDCEHGDEGLIVYRIRDQLPNLRHYLSVKLNNTMDPVVAEQHIKWALREIVVLLNRAHNGKTTFYGRFTLDTVYVVNGPHPQLYLGSYSNKGSVLADLQNFSSVSDEAVNVAYSIPHFKQQQFDEFVVLRQLLVRHPSLQRVEEVLRLPIFWSTEKRLGIITMLHERSKSRNFCWPKISIQLLERALSFSRWKSFYHGNIMGALEKYQSADHPPTAYGNTLFWFLNFLRNLDCHRLSYTAVILSGANGLSDDYLVYYFKNISPELYSILHKFALKHRQLIPTDMMTPYL